MDNKNYGIDLDRERSEQDGTEYQLGSAGRTCLASDMDKLSFEEFKKYLPAGEVQRGAEDTMDCATRAPLNILAGKFNYLYRNNLLTPEEKRFLIKSFYLTDSGIDFSDRFIAIKSGTTRDGNSLKAPCQAIHELGLIPKALLPLEKTMTWDEYHDPRAINIKMDDLAEEFKRYFTIYYEQVYDYSINESLDVAGFAWPRPVNGIYPRVEQGFNHAFERCRPAHKVFDNYTDPVDGDYIKALAPDYQFYDYGYRMIISRSIRQSWISDIIGRLLEAIKDIFNI